METSVITSGPISGTNFLRMIFLMVLFSISCFSFGQRLKSFETYSFEKNEVANYDLTSFVCKSVEGQVYIIWTVLEPSDNSIYKLERSKNNVDYEVVYSIKGAKSPGKMELINSFKDEKPFAGTSYYRIKRESAEEGTIVSNQRIINGMDIISDVLASDENFFYSNNKHNDDDIRK